MKKIFFALLLLHLTISFYAQSDTTIYDIVERNPRFPACEILDTTLAAKQQCSQQALLAVIYQNVQYPVAARMEGIEGTVVVSFVVEPDSLISNTKILRDIGGGCGDAVLSVVNAFNDSGIRWIPANQSGKDVRARMTLPIKFKLSEAPPYMMMEGDTVYTQFEEAANFKGDTSLEDFVTDNLKYPEAYEDSCLVGYMDAQLLIQPDGVVQMINLSDYLELGLDFQFEVMNLTNSMFGRWEAAQYQGRAVPSLVDLRLGFVPTNESACQTAISTFEQASLLSVEAVQLYEKEEIEASIEKMTEALALQPNNAEYLALRGQGYVDLENYQAACQDLIKARRILGTASFDQLLMIICRMDQPTSEVEIEENQ